MRLITKISPKTVCGNIKEIVEHGEYGDSGEITLFTVKGTAHGEARGKGGSRGEWRGLRGRFTAHRPEIRFSYTGSDEKKRPPLRAEDFMSGRLFINEAIHDYLVAGMYRADSEDVTPVAIDIIVAVRESERPGGVGYEYSYTVSGETVERMLQAPETEDEND